jgi:hypothetical protein
MIRGVESEINEGARTTSTTLTCAAATEGLGAGRLIGMALWAFVNDGVERRLFAI